MDAGKHQTITAVGRRVSVNIFKLVCNFIEVNEKLFKRLKTKSADTENADLVLKILKNYPSQDTVHLKL
jgi:hypothetical protein